MTTASLSSSPSTRVETAHVLHARASPLMAAGEFLAVGGLTLIVFPLAWLLRRSLGLDASEYVVGFAMFHAATFLNDPHFSVTYLLFYRDAPRRWFAPSTSRAQRARFLIAGVLVPIVLLSWVALAFASRSAQMLGNLIQGLYLLVGWHYAKQGFGALMVLSARRGTHWRALERRVMLFQCYAAWAFAWSNPARAAGEFEEKGVVYWAAAHPRWLELGSGALLALSTLALGLCLIAKWRRERRLPIAALSCFLITIWLWTIFTTLDPLVRYVIPALHSIQYLFFVGLMKRNQARAAEGSFGPPVATQLTVLALSALALGWILLRGGSALFDPSFVAALGRGSASVTLGATPLFAASYVVVNIHHYFMDAVIWRRDNPEMAYVLRAPGG